MKKAFIEGCKQYYVEFLIMAILAICIFGFTGEWGLAFGALGIIAITFLTLTIYYAIVFGAPIEVVESLSDLGKSMNDMTDTLEDIQDTNAYMNMTPKEQAFYRAMKEKEKKEK
ncbi:MAG: hypothetical protein IJ193_05535 [Bacilli bacterium]|nr:hypothetical protein [Bacilli bacterium]